MLPDLVYLLALQISFILKTLMMGDSAPARNLYVILNKVKSTKRHMRDVINDSSLIEDAIQELVKYWEHAYGALKCCLGRLGFGTASIIGLSWSLCGQKIVSREDWGTSKTFLQSHKFKLKLWDLLNWDKTLRLEN